MTTTIRSQSPKSFSWRSAVRAKHIALPSEHGAWVFLLSPLAIGLAAGGVRPASLLLFVAAMAAFLIRQPVTMAVKVISGRRSKGELANIVFWLGLYGLIGLAATGALVGLGFGYLFWLAVPAAPVFVWHLWLVSRRAERRQMLVEIVAAGVLALAAPAAFWVGRGQVDPTGWLLWALSWLQIAGTILYAYLRLEQRQLKQQPDRSTALRMARPALLYNTLAFVLVAGLAIGRIVPALLPLAYLIQPVETAWGALKPAVGVKPTIIGIRQLVISVLFTVVFILCWSL
ncbi:MAG: YwiC-like family protein [Chloroflexi bacterium]|nr:YwiC-like family protein [Chloroflexota bacterium]